MGDGLRARLQPNLLMLGAIFIGLVSLHSVANADTIYGITGDDNLITINTASPSSAALVGTLDTAASSLGLFFNNSSLYVYDTNNNVVRQINPTTAATVATINIGLAASPGEGDVAFHNGVGFLASTLAPDGSFGSTGTLFKFTLNANSAVTVATTIPQLDGLAFSSTGILYGLAQGGTALYTINTTTGAATEVGAGTGISDDCGGFACFGYGGLTFDQSGDLIAALSTFSTTDLYSIDPSTGLMKSLLGDVPYGQVSGLSTAPAQTPEPSSVFLVSSCLILAGLLRALRTPGATTRVC